MDIKRLRNIGPILYWTRWDLCVLVFLATLTSLLYQLLNWKWLALPWLPMALIGMAVSFIIGFKNNASYDRGWEARQIWGGIVNVSRSWAGTLINYFESLTLPHNEKKAIYLRLINRHTVCHVAAVGRFAGAKPGLAFNSPDCAGGMDIYHDGKNR